MACEPRFPSLARVPNRTPDTEEKSIGPGSGVPNQGTPSQLHGRTGKVSWVARKGKGCRSRWGKAVTETASPACSGCEPWIDARNLRPSHYLVGFLIARTRARGWKKLRRPFVSAPTPSNCPFLFLGQVTYRVLAGYANVLYIVFYSLLSFLISLFTGRKSLMNPLLVREKHRVPGQMVWVAC